MSSTVFLVAKPFPWETIDEAEDIARSFAKAEGYESGLKIIIALPKSGKVPPGSMFLVPDPLRLSDNLIEFIDFVATALQNDCQFVWAEKFYTLTDPDAPVLKSVTALLAQLPKCAKANRIKAGLHRVRVQGQLIGRKPLGNKEIELVLKVFEEQGGSIRGTARALKDSGLKAVSRTSIARIVKSNGRN